MMKALIILSGNINRISSYSKYIEEHHLVIACNGGAKNAIKLGIKPDIIIGDMDSIPKKILSSFNDVEKILHSHDKDDTDSELAVKEALKRGARKITIIGGLGGRIDHTLLNLKILTNCKVPIEIVDDYNQISYHKHSFSIEGKVGDVLSFIPQGCNFTRVESKGLKYPLTKEWFKSGRYSVSNELTESKAIVSFRNGSFILVRVRE